MNWHPIEPSPKAANNGELKIWGKLKQILKSEEGVAFFQYPVFGPWGVRQSEPDILLILRRFGIFVLEVKGCYLHNIKSIAGHTWEMHDWYKPTMQPWKQNSMQIDAVKSLMTDLAIYFPIHGRVILPFISEEQWKQSQLMPSGHDPIWTSDLLETEAFMNKVDEISKHMPAPKLSEKEWALLKSKFEHRNAMLDIENNRPEPIIIQYNGDVPDNATIKDIIAKSTTSHDWQEEGYTYLVATAKLDNERSKAFQPSHQINTGNKINTHFYWADSKPMAAGNEEKHQLVHLLFHKSLRHLVPDRIISRTTERTLLGRAIEEYSGSDEFRKQQLTHDIFEWSDAIATIESEGMSEGVEPSLEFTTPSIERLTKDIQRAFEDQLRLQVGVGCTFERAVTTYLRSKFRSTKYVVMEGFSFLTPLQKSFIEACRENGSQVIIIHPFRDEQKSGFEGITSTYSYLGIKPIKIKTDFKSSQGTRDLKNLKTGLFSSEKFSQPFNNDGSVIINSFRHQNDEVAYCINQIHLYLLTNNAIELQKDNIYKITNEKLLKDIVVVAQDPDSFAPLLLEEASLRNLPGNIFNTPPRQLLLTPLGQFILILYNIWKNDSLELVDDQFESLLASGLWSSAQSTTDRFRLIRNQWFAHCKTEGDWLSGFTSLKRHIDNHKDDNRLPSSIISKADIDTWNSLLTSVIGLCKLLFDGSKQSIRDHVDKLVQGLAASYKREELLDTELELLIKIEEALLELTKSESLAISPREFGDILNSLVKERKQVDPNKHFEIKPNKINIVKPQGIDNSKQKIIFYLGVNNKNIPRGHSTSWPIFNYNLDQHYEQERYIFLAVVRAATDLISISFSYTDGENAFKPSLYLTEITDTLGITLPKPLNYIQNIEIGTTIHNEIITPMSDFSTSDVFRFTDLYHYSLCPFRYKLERLDRRAKLQTDTFNLRFQAQGIWLRRAFEIWQDSGPLKFKVGTSPTQQAIDYLTTLVQQVKKDVQEYFPAFDYNDWNGIEHRVYSAIQQLCAYNIAKFRTKEAIGCKIEDGTIILNIEGQLDPIRVIENNLIILYDECNKKNQVIVSNVHLHEEWSIPRTQELEADTPATLLKDGAEIYTCDSTCFRKWQNDFQNFNNFSVQSRKELLMVIKNINSNFFPKNPGSHCSYCPAQSTCLGIE